MEAEVCRACWLGTCGCPPRTTAGSDDRRSVDLQRDALAAAGVDERHLHHDRASGAKDDRPGLKACLADLRSGDILVVWKLDRLGRSLPNQACRKPPALTFR